MRLLYAHRHTSLFFSTNNSSSHRKDSLCFTSQVRLYHYFIEACRMSTMNLQDALCDGPFAVFDNALPISIVDSMEQEILALSDTHFVPAKMGASQKWENEVFRGDRICWLTPNFCSEHNLIATTTALKTIMKSCGNYRRSLNASNCLTDFSVQCAIYDGINRGYVKHMDCTSTIGMHRQLTCIIYLNRNPVGGELRLYLENDVSSYADIRDVAPIFNRLVVFRSDIVPHEVRPSEGRRIAITLWASGSTPLSSMLKCSSISSSICRPAESAFHQNHALPQIQAISESHRIFVSIACYRDSEVAPTLLDLYSKAAMPHLIDTTILLQVDDLHDTHIIRNLAVVLEELSAYNVTLLRVPATSATGVMTARARIQEMYNNQAFYLQIDCHIRFRRNFDVYLISTLLGMGDKTILSTYPHAYTLSHSRAVIPDDIRPTIIIPSHFDSDGILRQKAKLLSSTATALLPTYLWAAGFSFSKGSVIVDCPYEPLEYIFFGEEISMALRLFVAGYTVYAPSETVVYHLWTRSHRPSFPQLSSQQLAQKHAAINRICTLASKVDSDILRRFEECVGINFECRTVLDEGKYKDLYANDMDLLFAENAVSCSNGADMTKLSALSLAIHHINKM